MAHMDPNTYVVRRFRRFVAVHVDISRGISYTDPDMPVSGTDHLAIRQAAYSEKSRKYTTVRALLAEHPRAVRLPPCDVVRSRSAGYLPWRTPDGMAIAIRVERHAGSWWQRDHDGTMRPVWCCDSDILDTASEALLCAERLH